MVRTNMDSNGKYTEVSRYINVPSLLRFIKEFSYCYKRHKHMAHSLYKSKIQLFVFYQGKEASGQDFLEKFNTGIAMLEQIGDTEIRSDSALNEIILKDHENGKYLM